MKLILGAATAAAVLAVPAVAGAHPSVYESTSVTNEVRYAVTNHGYTYVLRETNNLAGPKGVVGYNLIPSAWRKDKTFAQMMAAGGTGAQAHATCVGAAALESEAAIKSWQDADAFYNYVPFQTGSAGLEDTPARWLATLADVGVTAEQLTADAPAACAGLGGTYTPADTIQTSAAALAEGQTKPLQEEIKAVTATNTALTTELATAKSQLAAMQLAATPLQLTLASAKARSGAKLTVAGQPLKAVTVTVAIKESQARKYKLASSVIGRSTVTTGADGKATVTVKLGKAAAKRLKTMKRSLAVTAEATSGDRFATATGKMTR